MVLERTFKCLTAVILKRTDFRQVQWFYCCTCMVSADCWDAEAGLAAAGVLAAWWWLGERQHVVVFQVVKMAAMC